jgi:hypothetical protein
MSFGRQNPCVAVLSARLGHLGPHNTRSHFLRPSRPKPRPAKPLKIDGERNALANLFSIEKEWNGRRMALPDRVHSIANFRVVALLERERCPPQRCMSMPTDRLADRPALDIHM